MLSHSSFAQQITNITDDIKDGTLSTYTFESDCPNLNIVYSNQTVVLTSYGDIDVSISSVFWDNSVSSDTYAISITVDGVPSPSWLSIDPLNSHLVGSTQSHGQTFQITLGIDVDDISAGRNLTLQILEWTLSGWLTCSDASTCTQWDSLYELKGGSWVKTQESIDIENMKETAKVMGVSTATVSSAAMISTVSVASLASVLTSPQMMFTLAGFYQLLLTLILLNYRIPDTFVEFISSFGLFKLDFTPITNSMMDDSSLSDTLLNEDFNQSNVRMTEIGYESGSMMNNYLLFFIAICFIVVFHLIHNKGFSSCKFYVLFKVIFFT